MNSSEEWVQCDPGQLTQLAGRVRTRRTRRRLTRAALVVTAVAALVGAWVFRPSDEGHVIAGISCARVTSLAEAYLKHKLPPEQERKFVDTWHFARIARPCSGESTEFQTSSRYRRVRFRRKT